MKRRIIIFQTTLTGGGDAHDQDIHVVVFMRRTETGRRRGIHAGGD